jgi:hypothetical protein
MGFGANEMFTSSACFSSAEGFSINSAVLNVRVFLSVSSPSSFFSFRPRTVSLLIQTAGKSKIRLCFFPQTTPYPYFYLLYHYSRGASSLTPLVYYSLRAVFVCSSKRACIQAGCSYLVYVSLALECGGLLMLGCFFFGACLVVQCIAGQAVCRIPF